MTVYVWAISGYDINDPNCPGANKPIHSFMRSYIVLMLMLNLILWHLLSIAHEYQDIALLGCAVAEDF